MCYSDLLPLRDEREEDLDKILALPFPMSDYLEPNVMAVLERKGAATTITLILALCEDLNIEPTHPFPSGLRTMLCFFEAWNNVYLHMNKIVDCSTNFVPSMRCLSMADQVFNWLLRIHDDLAYIVVVPNTSLLVKNQIDE